MRDFRDAKAMAQTIRAALAAKGLKITISESLELPAKAFGAPDWNTLSAAIKAADATPREPPSPAEPPDNNQALDGLAKALGLSDWNKLMETVRAARPATAPAAPADLSQPAPIAEFTGRTSFSQQLQATLARAVGQAAARRHGYTTLEHLLLALIEDADAAAVMEACQVDTGALATTLTRYIDDELKPLTAMGDGGGEPGPTAGFHRAVQRAVVHVQSGGRDVVTGANILVAIFSERESHAAYFLKQQEMHRYDAVNFIAHGIRKDGGKAA